MLLRDAGHFQLLDEQSLLQRAICAVGPVQDEAVRNIAQVRLTSHVHTGNAM